MKNSNKKGFTLVELLVVIAILAILATVAVVGYTSFTDKAYESNDRSLVAQLNTAITKVDGKYETMHEVVEVLAENGFDATKIDATSKKHEILWNMAEQEFFYSADVELSGADIWIVSETVSEEYSTYYIGANDATLTTTLGFDAGYATGLTVTYDGTNNNSAQTVIIRTNSENTELIIKAYETGTYGTSDYACDSVKIYGLTGLLDIVNGGQASVHTYGNIGFTTLTKGALVVETGVIEATYIPDASAEVKVNANNGTVNAVYVKLESDKETLANKINVGTDNVDCLFDNADEVNDESVANAIEEKIQEAATNAANKVVSENNKDAVCRIGTTGYNSLDDAMKAVKHGDTIVILKDISKRGWFNYELGEITITIEGNGHKLTNTWNPENAITGEDSGSGYGLVLGTSDYETPLRPTVYINNLIVESYYRSIYATDTCDMYLENCISIQTSSSAGDRWMLGSLAASYTSDLIINSGDYTANNGYAIYAHNTGSNIVVNGGTFSGIIQADTPSSDAGYGVKVTINGGVFNNCSFVQQANAVISINGGTFSCDPTEYVNTDTHTVTEDNGMWTVVAK